MPKPKSKAKVREALRRERAIGNDLEALIGAVDPALPIEEKAVKACRPRISTIWREIRMFPEGGATV